MSETLYTKNDDGRLGRSVIRFDDRSLAYPARGVLFREGAEIVTQNWRRVPAWDQGLSSECVAYSVRGICWTSPFRAAIPYKERRAISFRDVYESAQRIDEWPGENYDGTSVLAGMKVGKERGWFSEYRWCFGVDDVLRTLSHHGPVAIGVTWYDSMFEWGKLGMLYVNTRSRVSGGHAVELTGLNAKQGYVRGTNSWGKSWGHHGAFRMRFEDLDFLLRDYGEAVTATAPGAPETV